MWETIGSKMRLVEKSWDRRRGEYTTSWIEFDRDVIQEYLPDQLLRRLLAMLRDLLESAVCRSKDRVVSSGAVEDVDQLLIIGNQLRELGRVLALADQLVDGLVRLVAVVSMMGLVWFLVLWRATMRRLPVGRPVMWWTVERFSEWRGRFKPALSIEAGLVDGFVSCFGGFGCPGKGIVQCGIALLLHTVEGILDGIKDIILGWKPVQNGTSSLFWLDGKLVQHLLVWHNPSGANSRYSENGKNLHCAHNKKDDEQWKERKLEEWEKVG